MIGTRQQQLEEALFRGDSLTLENPDYLREVQELTGTLLRSDLAPKDLTAEALAIRNEPVNAVIMARERGVVAGLAEFGLLMEAAGVTVHFEKKDGDTFEAGDILLRLEGDQN